MIPACCLTITPARTPTRLFLPGKNMYYISAHTRTHIRDSILYGKGKGIKISQACNHLGTGGSRQNSYSATAL